MRVRRNYRLHVVSNKQWNVNRATMTCARQRLGRVAGLGEGYACAREQRSRDSCKMRIGLSGWEDFRDWRQLLEVGGAKEFFWCWRELARTQAPTTRNCTVELFAFGIIAGVSPSGVQCKSLALEEAPWWSGLLPRQVSMSCSQQSSALYKVFIHCMWFHRIFREQLNTRFLKILILHHFEQNRHKLTKFYTSRNRGRILKVKLENNACIWNRRILETNSRKE